MNIEPIADKSKLKAGDTIAVRGKVVGINTDNDEPYIVCEIGEGSEWPGVGYEWKTEFVFRPDAILGVIDKPLEPGDHVYSYHLPEDGGRIIAIHDDDAWLAMSDGEHWTLSLKLLRRTRD